MKKQKGYIRAFICDNLGDDIFIKLLAERYDNVEWLVVVDNDLGTNIKKINNVKVLHLKGFYVLLIRLRQRILNKCEKCFDKLIKKNKRKSYSLDGYLAKKCGISVYIAGSVFMEPQIYNMENYRKQEAYYNMKPYVLGCNFGPYYSNEYLELHKELFSKTKCVSFRDTKSFSYFKDYNNIGWAPDIIFGYDKTQIILPKIKDYILISVANVDKDKKCVDNSEYAPCYIEFLKNIVTMYLKKNKYVVLIGFCNNQGDKKIIDEVLSENSSKRIISVNYPDNSIEECVGYFCNAETVIATRYHAMILGWLFEKSVVPICYNEKMSNVIEDIEKIEEREIYRVQLKDINIENYSKIFSKCLKNNTLKKETISYLVKESSKHFKLLDEEIGK